MAVTRKQPTFPYRRTGDILRAAREKAGISQRGLAKSAGMHQADISSYETGKMLPELPRLARIVIITGADLNKIMRSVLADTHA
jgi:transcriptional regulator with XRE-family HTH domain